MQSEDLCSRGSEYIREGTLTHGGTRSRNFYKFLSEDKTHIYHVSIIDYLQPWDCNKKSEKWAKTHLMQRNWKDMSAVHPDFYCQRFINFMEKYVVLTSDSACYNKLFKKSK
jgi:hypothetical protein